MKKIVLSLALIGLLFVGGQATAVLCSLDDVPAASLLLPYFEVDINDAQGITTLFEINNASAAPAIAHVTLWTTWSVPTLDFDVYLTGYDIVPINVRDIFNGILPLTDHNNIVASPIGAFSWPNAANPVVDFASCDPYLPYGPLAPILVSHIRAWHTGAASPIFGTCASFTSTNAIGYITVDSVSLCSTDFPTDIDYFIDGGLGTANNLNLLWGNYYIVDPANNFAEADTLVALEATAQGVAGLWAPTDYTFYHGKQNEGAGPYFIDNREPLGTTWAARYITGGAFSGGTMHTAWRSTEQFDTPLTCGLAPDWWPMGASQIVIFDEEENPDLPPGCTVSPCIPGDVVVPFPEETQKVLVGGPNFPIPFNNGWIYLNLNWDPVGTVSPDGFDQSYVGVTMSAEGRYTVGYAAFMLNSACAPADIILPVPEPN